MDANHRDQFIRLWEKYFPGAELPITFYYTDEAPSADLVKPPVEHRCIFADLVKVRTGQSLCFDAQALGCFGGKRYLGFDDTLMPNFEYFLSCGIPGKLEGERYKKTPALVKAGLAKMAKFDAPGKFIVFKRWDELTEADEPDVVVFFARPDVLSGLFTLANFDVADPNGVFTPFAAGCGSIVQYPYREQASDSSRAVLGLFDVSARPFIPEDMLSFAVPRNKFERMIDNMAESFLITPSWAKIRKRIA
ncbi:MAG: DUF169 domain-containing protein [Planctomycetes bacterium]|jgi:hypothetical protein|nr:DUF169 domain-containing protein [Planctomycetota bacterium]